MIHDHFWMLFVDPDADALVSNPEFFVEHSDSRSDPSFWATFDWFQEYALRDDPLHAGLYDLNRYYPRAEE